MTTTFPANHKGREKGQEENPDTKSDETGKPQQNNNQPRVLKDVEVGLVETRTNERRKQENNLSAKVGGSRTCKGQAGQELGRQHRDESRPEVRVGDKPKKGGQEGQPLESRPPRR